jgi:hypothetical protein
MFVLGLLASIAFGTYVEMQKIVVPEVEAHEVATTTPDKIVEIVDVPDISPTEVAMWFVESDTQLLQAFRDSDFDAVEDIIQTRHAYAVAVALKTYESDTK